MIQLANQQEQAEAKLAQALQATGNFTRENFEALKQYAGQLQQVTTFGDEATIEIMAQLQAMGLNIEQTKEAARQAQNLAALMGTDLSTAARIMAYAFNGNVGMLNRYIKGLDETIFKSRDFDKILQELNAHIGGQAEALAKTTSGQIQQFNNLWGDAQERIGKLVKQALLPLLSVGRDVLAWFNGLSPATVNFIGVLSSLTIVAWKLVPAFKAWNLQLQILGISVKTALGWIGILISAATLLFTAWSSNLLGIRDKLTVFWQYVKTVFQSIWLLVKDVGSRLLSFYQGVFQAIGELLRGNFQEAAQAAHNAAQAIVGNWDQTMKRIDGLWEATRRRLKQTRQQEVNDERQKQQQILQLQQQAAQESIQIEQRRKRILQRSPLMGPD